MSSNLTARKNAALANATSATLIEALLQLESIPQRTPDQRMARVWLLEELEARYPHVEATMNEWADNPDPHSTYVETLLAALPIEAFNHGQVTA